MCSGLERERRPALAFPSGTVFKYPSEGILTRPPQTVASISAGKHRAKAVVDIRGDEGRSGSRRSANGVHHPGVTARAEGIRCARLSRERGTAQLLFSPSAGSCGGQAPQRQRQSTNGGTGAIFQETVTYPRYAPAASAALRAVERFWELTPLGLRRAGVPARPATLMRTAVQQERAVGVVQRRCLKK